jgi:hypothetical protein
MRVCSLRNMKCEYAWPIPESSTAAALLDLLGRGFGRWLGGTELDCTYFTLYALPMGPSYSWTSLSWSGCGAICVRLKDHLFCILRCGREVDAPTLQKFYPLYVAPMPTHEVGPPVIVILSIFPGRCTSVRPTSAATTKVDSAIVLCCVGCANVYVVFSMRLHVGPLLARSYISSSTCVRACVL